MSFYKWAKKRIIESEIEDAEWEIAGSLRKLRKAEAKVEMNRNIVSDCRKRLHEMAVEETEEVYRKHLREKDFVLTVDPRVLVSTKEEEPKQKAG